MRSLRLFQLLLTLCLATTLYAQVPDAQKAPADTLKGRFWCREAKIYIYLDLAEESLTVPGYDILGKVNGYIIGTRQADGFSSVYNIWFLTDWERKEGGYLLTFSNDMGADEQQILFTRLPDGRFRYKTQGGNSVRKAAYVDQKRKKTKWVKLPDEMTFELR